MPNWRAKQIISVILKKGTKPRVHPGQPVTFNTQHVDHETYLALNGPDSAVTMAELKYAMRIIDRDGIDEDEITTEQLKQQLMSVGEQLFPEEASELMATMDPNRTGTVNRSNMAETLMRDRPRPIGPGQHFHPEDDFVQQRRNVRHAKEAVEREAQERDAARSALEKQALKHKETIRARYMETIRQRKAMAEAHTTGRGLQQTQSAQYTTVALKGQDFSSSNKPGDNVPMDAMETTLQSQTIYSQ